MLAELTWRGGLLGAIFAIDLMLILDLIAREWRDWSGNHDIKRVRTATGDDR